MLTRSHLCCTKPPSPGTWIQIFIRPQSLASDPKPVAFICRHPPSRHFVLFPGPCPDHTHPFYSRLVFMLSRLYPCLPRRGHCSPLFSLVQPPHFLQKTETYFHSTKSLIGLLMLYLDSASRSACLIKTLNFLRAGDSIII